MQGLAKFVMTGRKQAIMAAVLLGLIPLINFLTPVVIGLVLLRKGLQEASLVLVWAILPLGAWTIAGDPVPLIMTLGIVGLAYILRETESWEFTLLAAIAIGAAVEMYLRLQPAVMDLVFLQVEVLLESGNYEGLQLEELREVMTSMIGAVYMFVAIVLLMLSRWMQAGLYNPGGFQQELHGLRVEQKVALGLVALMILTNVVAAIPNVWALYLVMPLMFSGLALIHAVVAIRKLNGVWLIVLYTLLLLPIVTQIVVLLAIMDSWYDFRKRLSGQV